MPCPSGVSTQSYVGIAAHTALNCTVVTLLCRKYACAGSTKFSITCSQLQGCQTECGTMLLSGASYVSSIGNGGCCDGCPMYAKTSPLYSSAGYAPCMSVSLSRLFGGSPGVSRI